MFIDLANPSGSRTLLAEFSANLGRCTVPTAWEREQERERKAQYLAEREAETRRRNALIDRRLADLDKILPAGLSQSAPLDHNARKAPLPVFDAGGLHLPYAEPTLEELLPREPGAFARLVPGWKGRHEAQRLRAEAEFSSSYAECSISKKSVKSN